MPRKSLIVLLPCTLALAVVARRLVPGPGPGGETVLPSGWRIHPAGRSVPVGTLPLSVITLTDGSLAVTNDGYGDNGLVGIDPVAAETRWEVPLAGAWLGLAGVGDTLWAGGGGTNCVYRLVRTGDGWHKDSVALATDSTRVFPAGLALVPGRGELAVVGNLSDSVYLLDRATLGRRRAFAVGHRPYTAVADSGHLYVSDWGDSTVSVLDLGAPERARRTIVVGPHPSALALGAGELFAALAGTNGVARVDLVTGRVKEQLTVSLGSRGQTGSDPNALALGPDHTLYVAMAGNNAVAVVHLEAGEMRVAGLIPVGWYPTAVAVSADGRTLYVVNGRGSGSAPNPDHRYVARLITGSVSAIPIPDAATLARYTGAVHDLSPYTNPTLRSEGSDSFPPALRHVVYVIRENRTYDQVLGDMPEGDGDNALALFNDSVTPNAHAIARHWVLFDNFYVDGDVSADGHEWTDAAFANDYNEKTWPQVYSGRRPWDLTSGEDLANRRGGYLWDAARRRGRAVVNFGEMTESDERDPDAATRAHTNLPGLQEITAATYPGFVLSVPDTVRARLFADSVDSWDHQGRYPDLVLLWLPRDHTVGRRAGGATPRAMVADNDLALGAVIERLRRSPVWDSLVVFAVEDDAQNGPDHVDAHRSVLLVASPFARRHVVDSTFYTTSSVVRSIGLILGLPPLSEYDASATPLGRAFTTAADTAAFIHRAPTWPLDERNPQAFRSAIPRRDLAGPDEADETVLNWEIWTSVRPTPPPPPRRSLLAP